MRSMDAQLLASRGGALGERQHLSSEIANIKLSFESRVRDMELARMQDIGALKNDHAAEIRSLKTQFQHEKTSTNNQFGNTEKKLLHDISQLNAQVQTLTLDGARKQAMLDDFRGELEDMKSRARPRDGDADTDTDTDDVSMQSSMPSEFLSASDFDDDTSSLQSSVNTMGVRRAGGGRRRGQAKKKSRMYKIFHKVCLSSVVSVSGVLSVCCNCLCVYICVCMLV